MGALGCGLGRGNGGEVYEELRKRMIDVCCLHEVRWSGQGARMLGMKGRTYRQWWCGKMRWSLWCGSHGEGGAV